MVLDCRCKGISSTHTQAAQATALEKGHAEVTADTLYASALSFKRADRSAKITGAEDYNGDGDICRRCRDTFERAATETAEQIAARTRRVIPIARPGESPVTGRCGNDCTTCVKNTSGCAPVTA